ncbi:MAG: EamA/RhaT family transporter [Bacteroidetes bacterium]|nr:MAG: EamA/RhaT family transporter [Bacteroidota bacterium]
MNKNLQAHIALFLAQVLYAASFPIAKIVMEDIPYNVLVVMRVIGAVILFWASSLIVNEKVERKDFLRLFGLGICGVAVNQSLFLKGLHLTSPIDAAIMMITTPILVLIIASLIIKERITLLKFSGIAIGFSGAAYLIFQNLGATNKESSFLGDMFIFINAISWGTFLVLVKPLMKKYHTITILKWTFLFGLPLVLPFGISDGIVFDWQNLSMKIILYAGFVIVFTTFVAYLLNTLALKELSPSIASAYIYMQPFLTALLTIFIFGNDTLTWEKVFSALLIFAGVYLVSMQGKENKVI